MPVRTFQLTPDEWAQNVRTGPNGRPMYVDAREGRRLQQIADDRRYRNKWFNVIRAASIAIPTVGAGLALAGPAAAGAGSAAAGTVNGLPIIPYAGTAAMAPTGAGMASVGGGIASRIPWMSAASQGVNTLAGIYGARQQSRANRDAMAASERANAEAMAFEHEQMAESRRQFDIQQAAAREALAAQNKFEGDRFAASEEERLYRRRLEDERELRRAPFRQASADALGRIPGILASGRTSPGLGSLGSYRRG